MCLIYVIFIYLLLHFTCFFKDVENDGPEPSDWDRYAAEEYEILVAEESGTEQLQEGWVLIPENV